jgi:hypothetical protein
MGTVRGHGADRRGRDLAEEAARAADTAGRVLAAANAALPLPGQPRLRLWQALTTLREHRGDGHNAALVAAGIGPVHAHVLKLASGESEPGVLQRGRSWDEEDWSTATRDLLQLGWLTEDVRLSDAGAAARDGRRAAHRRGRGRRRGGRWATPAPDAWPSCWPRWHGRY